jgi:hypothetical protein
VRKQARRASLRHAGAQIKSIQAIRAILKELFNFKIKAILEESFNLKLKATLVELFDLNVRARVHCRP